MRQLEQTPNGPQRRRLHWRRLSFRSRALLTVWTVLFNLKWMQGVVA